MQQKITLRIKPSAAADHASIVSAIAGSSGNPLSAIIGFQLLKRSIDARSRETWINLTVLAFINEPFLERELQEFDFKNVSAAKKQVVIIGAGPAGLFAALQLILKGIRPIVLERGKDVRARRRDLAILNKQGIINPESNYCFGEGGAGTYSDGKLYTRSNKRGNIEEILNLFVRFGAAQEILYESHPHIGTNKLPSIISAMRQQILESGGLFLFEKKLVDFTIAHDNVIAVTTADGDAFKADAFILATGHSARDVFELLDRKKITIEAKPFALGVRIEHPQELIDGIQYRSNPREAELPPASYSLVEQVNKRAVFSFCMCPGGIIAPASTADGELVVNGWSPSKRNNPFANSGMVVPVTLEDATSALKKTRKPLPGEDMMLLHFQRMVEQQCYIAGGGNFVAPAQRMVDFCEGKISKDLPVCSYGPGLKSVSLNNLLPGFIYEALSKGLVEFGKKMPARNGRNGYYTNEAVIVATESRTSSPVRIPRGEETLAHPQLKNLFPCGEGAGYAGGIVSAAMDGQRVATAIALSI